MPPITPPLYEQPWPEGEYRLFQVGFVVDDLLGTAADWARVFGVGPFHVLPAMEAPFLYRGTPTGIKIQVAVTQAGPVQVELIKQHCDRPSIYRDFLEGGRTRFNQLCTVTTDYEAKKAYYEGLGYELAAESPLPPRAAYFDTFADFGFVTEVVEHSPDFLGSLAGIARTCAEWDGTDPVRILTRDGYRTP